MSSTPTKSTQHGIVSAVTADLFPLIPSPPELSEASRGGGESGDQDDKADIGVAAKLSRDWHAMTDDEDMTPWVRNPGMIQELTVVFSKMDPARQSACGKMTESRHGVLRSQIAAHDHSLVELIKLAGTPADPLPNLRKLRLVLDPASRVMTDQTAEVLTRHQDELQVASTGIGSLVRNATEYGHVKGFDVDIVIGDDGSSHLARMSDSPPTLDRPTRYHVSSFQDLEALVPSSRMMWDASTRIGDNYSVNVILRPRGLRPSISGAPANTEDAASLLADLLYQTNSMLVDQGPTTLLRYLGSHKLYAIRSRDGGTSTLPIAIKLFPIAGAEQVSGHMQKEWGWARQFLRDSALRDEDLTVSILPHDEAVEVLRNGWQKREKDGTWDPCR